jgi:hypothetical protein
VSIKNIIQQENDLQEMSTQSLANYLNNPTGQYNPYLVAGELQRKEAFAQRQMTEAPQGTVVDELVAKTMPMGGMPMGGMPQMPQPRPEEMVSESITETGIANLPAPNIGQNYAGGGIVGYEEGGDVLYNALDYTGRGLDYAVDALDNPVVQGIETALFPKFALAAGLLPEEVGDGEMYDFNEDGSRTVKPEVQALMDEQNMGGDLALGGAGIAGTLAAKQKLKTKKAATKKPPKTRSAAALLGLKELVKRGKDKFKPKKLNKKEKADAKAKKIKDDKAKVKADKAAAKVKKDGGFGSGPVSQGLKKVGKVGVPAAFNAAGRGIKYLGFTDPAVLGLGGLGYGAYKAYDYFDPFGTKQKEAEETLAKENKDSMEMHRQTRLRREANERVQAQLDAQQAAKDRRREKEMYLALALGGAKTMAGQSPFALSNVGEGLGAGVGALAAYDQNEMERMAASQAATAKAQQDMAIALADYTSNYYKGKADLSDEAKAELAALEIEKNELIPEDYVAKKEDIYLRYLGVAPGDYKETINEQTFYAAE